jgi:rhodanese-related sulfurtransferase
VSFFSSLFGGAAPSTRVDGQTARRLAADGAVLVDVRTPAEFRSGSIPGAQNIPVDQLGARLGEFDKQAQIVVFCRSGARSASAAGLLQQAGFAKVADLGPVSAW